MPFPAKVKRCAESLQSGPCYRGQARLSTTSQSHSVRQGRVAAPSVCFAAACIPLAAAPTAPPCFRHWRRSSPLPLVGEPLAKPFTLRGLPKPLLLGATATTAASGGNREELLGPRPAGCERQRSRRWEPQPGQCHRRVFARRYRSYPPYISRRQTISKPLAKALLRLY